MVPVDIARDDKSVGRQFQFHWHRALEVPGGRCLVPEQILAVLPGDQFWAYCNPYESSLIFERPARGPIGKRKGRAPCKAPREDYFVTRIDLLFPAVVGSGRKSVEAGCSFVAGVNALLVCCIDGVKLGT